VSAKEQVTDTAGEERIDSSENRKIPRRIWNGTALQVLGRIFGSGCTFAILALCARGLPTEEFGRYTFYLALFGLLDALADFGTGQAVIRLTANNSEALRPALRQARRARFATASLGLIAIAICTDIYDEPGRGWIILAALYPLTHTLELTATIFKNQIAWGIPVLVRAFASALRLGLVATVLWYGTESAPELLFITALASSTANVLLHFASRKYIPKAKHEQPLEQSLLRTSFPLGLGSLFAMGYFYIDNLFIRAFEDDIALAHYNAGVRLLSFLIMIAQLATATALPWFVRLHGKGELAKALSSLGQPLFAMACCLAGLLIPWSKEILEVVFTDAFAAGSTSFQWLLATSAVIHAGAIFVTALIAVGGQNRFMLVAGFGLLLNMLGNYILVPKFGIEGAALATLATESLVCVLSICALVRMGCRPLSVRPWGWLAGPIAFAASLSISTLIH
jgi:O-antigen/teichoic acid export membrane protein